MFSQTPFTIDDLVDSGWEQVIADSPERDCQNYCTRFGTKAREAEQAGNWKNAEILQLLAAATSMYMDLDGAEPFRPLMVLGGERTAIVDNFSDINLQTFVQWGPAITDSELRARLADIVWYRNHDHQAGQLAVESYLESARQLEDPEHWVASEQRLDRALQVAAGLGRNGAPFKNVIARIEELLDKFQGQDPLFFSIRLMELLLKYGEGDPAKYIPIAENAALQGGATQDWHKAQLAWVIKSKWHARQKDAAGARLARLASAEEYVKEAEAATKRPGAGYGVAAHILQQGIEAFRRIPNTRERVQDLHKLLLEYQAKSVAELKPISAQMDISQFVAEAEAKVKGKPIQEALIELASITAPQNVQGLRKHVEEMAKVAPLRFLFVSSTVDDSGKVIARDPGRSFDNDELNEEGTRAEMYREAARFQEVYAQAVIAAASQQINLDHDVRVRDLMPLVMNNPFVPPGRETIFARGLHAGLQGDLMIAAHLLMPQVENSLRYLLNLFGIVTSKLDKDGIQEERALGELLYMPELSNILGEDIVFDLQGLLNERHGSNLRNRLSHGMLGENQVMSLQVLYFWWQTLHLCLFTKVLVTKLAQQQHATNTTDEPNQNDSNE